MEEAKIEHLYDLTHTAAAPYLKQFVYPWEALRGVGDFIRSLGATLSAEQYDHPSADVWIAKSAKVFPTATILGPTIIGPETEVRPGAVIPDHSHGGGRAIDRNSTE